MKKFLSICLVALCSVSAMYAQTTTPTTEATVECGSSVTMTATPEPHYHFTKWVMTDNNNDEHEYTAGSGTDYTCTTDNASGINTLEITLSPTMIGYAQNGELVFKAFFAEDSKYTITGIAVNNDATYTPNTEAGTITVTHEGNITNDSYTGYANDPVTLTATADACYEFVKWIDENGTTVSSSASFDTTVQAVASGTTYKAVFKKKTVKVTVTSDNSSQGKVAIAPAGE